MRYLNLLLCGACLLAAPGCAGGGFLAYLFGGGESIPAAYFLEDRPTLVLVDDPNSVLGSASLPGVELLDEDEVTVELESNLSPEELRGLPEFQLVTTSN